MRKGIEEVSNPAVKRLVGDQVGVSLWIEAQDTALDLMRKEALIFLLVFFEKTRDIAVEKLVFRIH